jgi:hypothetical protein
MPGFHDPFDEDELTDELTPTLDPIDPDDRGEGARGTPAGVPDDEPDPDDDDREHRVAHRPNPLPAREEDEEELAEADILDELDLEDYDRRGGFDT